MSQDSGMTKRESNEWCECNRRRRCRSGRRVKGDALDRSRAAQRQRLPSERTQGRRASCRNYSGLAAQSIFPARCGKFFGAGRV